MQKLSHKSIYNLYKRCRSTHKEYNKIDFAFLGYFYDFIWILQDSAKTPKRLKNLFMSRPLERFGPSQIFPRFAPKTLERAQTMQCGPQAWGWWRSEILAGCSPERAREGEERGLGVTYDWSATGVGVKQHRRKGHRGAAGYWPLRMGVPVRWRPGRASSRHGGSSRS
jgi:hypothetical protein